MAAPAQHDGPGGDRPTLVSFWHGPLTWLERLCIASCVRQGHPFDLYAYERPEGLPAGAGWIDAATILPREKMFFYKGKGTAAVFSDLFRVHLLAAGAGVWVDCDIYCVRPLAGLGPYVMGYERAPGAKGRGGSVNSAVLLVPPDAPILDDLRAVFHTPDPPLFEPHLPPFRRIEVAARRLLGEKVGPEYMQYGATGPFALTHFVKKHGLADKVLPPEAFYPVPYEQIPSLMRPGSSVAPFITPQTFAIHIWRSQLTDRGRAGLPAPAPGSALDRLCRSDDSAHDSAEQGLTP